MAIVRNVTSGIVILNITNRQICLSLGRSGKRWQRSIQKSKDHFKLAFAIDGSSHAKEKKRAQSRHPSYPIPMLQFP